jgi:hypothetical protein
VNTDPGPRPAAGRATGLACEIVTGVSGPAAAPLAADRAWTDIPGVAFVGIAMGLAFLWFAIRYMIGKKK